MSPESKLETYFEAFIAFKYPAAAVSIFINGKCLNQNREAFKDLELAIKNFCKLAEVRVKIYIFEVTIDMSKLY